MLREDIQNAIKEAMKNHETERLSTVRMIFGRGLRKKTLTPRQGKRMCRRCRSPVDDADDDQTASGIRQNVP